jgi:hypothetical protein
MYRNEMEEINYLYLYLYLYVVKQLKACKKIETNRKSYVADDLPPSTGGGRGVGGGTVGSAVDPH